MGKQFNGDDRVIYEVPVERERILTESASIIVLATDPEDAIDQAKAAISHRVPEKESLWQVQELSGGRDECDMSFGKPIERENWGAYAIHGCRELTNQLWDMARLNNAFRKKIDSMQNKGKK